MITLFTGLPGAGKTLNMIKYVYENHQDRPVYVYGIKELNVPDWQQITLDELQKWYELPHGSVILVDEVQDIWPARSLSKDVPYEVKKLAQNRHQGYDLYFTCQNPVQVDKALRDVTSYHIHLHRPFGAKFTNMYKWEGVVTQTDNPSKLKLAQSSIVKFDKKYFDFYKSAEIHTVKFKLPKIFYILILAFLYLIYSGYKAYNNFFNKDIQHESQQSSIEIPQNRNNVAFLDSHRNQIDYIQQSIPRHDNIPDSAPLFDSLQEAVSKPRLQCLYTETESQGIKCRCYSQQATRLHITTLACINYVTKGYHFDHTLPDLYYENGANNEAKASAAGESFAPFDLIQHHNPGVPVSITSKSVSIGYPGKTNFN